MLICRRAVLVAVAALPLLAPWTHARAEEVGAAGETATVHRVRSVPLGVGFLLLGTSYIVKILGGMALVTASVDGGCGSCAWHEAGLFLVPIAGPLLVANVEDPHRRSSTDWVIFASWSAVEAVALTFVTVGFVGHDVPAEPARPTRPSVTVIPTVTHDLAALSLHVSW